MSWDTVKLSQIASSQYGFTASSTSEPIGPRFLRITDIVPSSISWDNVPFCAADDATRTKYLLRKGDIVVARTGATTGYAKLIRADVDAIFASYLVRFQITDERANPDFVGRILESHVYKAYVDGVKGGAAQPNANAVSLGNFEFKLPPLPTQQRIAGILSAYDDLIENNRRRIELLEQAARLLYREWFVHLRFPGHEAAKIVDGIPEGWSIQLLSDLCVDGDGIQTGPFGSQLHQSDYTDSGVPVVMPKDMKDNKVDCDGIARIPESLADKLGRHRMMPGDTVYGRRGDIGRRAFIGKRQNGFFCGTGCLRIRPDVEKINARYLFETLGSPATAGFIANQAKGSTMPNLSAGALKKVPVLCAPHFLQSQFAEIVEPMFETAEILDEQITRLTRARDLLLPRLMDGRIPV